MSYLISDTAMKLSIRVVSTSRDPGQTAFSLIELLVVIAIIGVLAGMLIPALFKAKQKAKSARCQSNLKQLGIIVRAYADDHEERFPWISESKETNSDREIENKAIRKILSPEDKNSTMFKCPSDRSENFDLGGSSYLWNPLWNGKLIDKSRKVRGILDQILILDSHRRHPKGGTLMANAVFEDGHVESIK